jgi:DNA polymerase
MGFGGGVAAYEKMAANYDLDLSGLDLLDIRDAYRDSVPRITAYWRAVEQAAKLALTAKVKGTVVQVTTAHSNLYPGSLPEVQFATYKGHLLCKLPSGRTLWYRDAHIVPGKFGNGAVSYMGVNQFNRQWVRIETWGGMLVENITQATARDLLADAMLEADKLSGVDLLGSVHDEILAEVTGHAAYARLLATMKVVPTWAKGLPLDAAGYVGERFGK